MCSMQFITANSGVPMCVVTNVRCYMLFSRVLLCCSHPKLQTAPCSQRSPGDPHQSTTTRTTLIEYDFRGRSGSGSYGAPTTPGGGASSLYPRIGQPAHGPAPAPQRTAPYHHGSASSAPSAPPPAPSSSSSTSMGIQVAINPEYRITPPPQLAPQMVEIPRSTFNFDFEYERKILAEGEKENPNWSKFVVESRPAPRPAPPPPQVQPEPPRGPRHAAPVTSVATPGDPVVEKYISMGLGREAVSFAVLNFGDNPSKVKEFDKSYNALHEMGFTSPNVPELLAIHDNDPDKVIQHLLSTT